MIELGLLGLAAVSGAAVAIYWTKILQWAQNSLLPWVDEHLPSLSDDVRNALVSVDNVVTPIRAAAKRDGNAYGRRCSSRSQNSNG